MNTLTAYKEKLCGFLGEGEGLKRTYIRSEFPAQAKPIPLKEPLVAVGFETVAIQRQGLDSFLGDGEQGTVIGRELNLVLRMDVAVPGATGGGGCHDIFEALGERLLFSENDYNVKQIGCDPIFYDRETGAYRLVARAEITALLHNERPEDVFIDFDLRRKEQ